MPTMKAVFFSHELPNLTEVRDLEIPEPGDDEILVKNVAVASNPKDWKLPLWMPEWSAVEGNDIAGTVAKVGKDVTDFKEGDRVAAFTIMRKDSKYGAYAEYSVSPAHTAWHLADSTSYEDAATLPLAAMTAAIGLFRRLGLQEPPATGTGNAEGVVVVNGASSSVGAFVVQLAKRAGYTVVAIAGQSSDVPKELGADHIIDYRGKDSKALGKAVKDAVAQSGKKIVGVYDAVSTEATVETFAYEVLQPEGGQITTVLPSHENGDGLTVKNVKVIRTYVGSAHENEKDFGKKWFRQIGKWLDGGSFKANRVKLMPNGLDSVNEGVHLLKDNKVNGVKLVYRIADSKCLKN